VSIKVRVRGRWLGGKGGGTIMEAPMASSSMTHGSSPFIAAKCRAVTPFSARLSMYLHSALGPSVRV